MNCEPSFSMYFPKFSSAHSQTEITHAGLMKTLLAMQVELRGQVGPMHLVVHFVLRKKCLVSIKSSFKGWPQSWKTEVRAKKRS